MTPNMWGYLYDFCKFYDARRNNIIINHSHGRYYIQSGLYMLRLHVNEIKMIKTIILYQILTKKRITIRIIDNDKQR